MPNRLAAESSSYLRAAADQPIDWYPWGPEAFDRARREGKPILLDIGAAWCHWCHVMDHESYTDPAVAELINRDWVAIKVDRDQRPDVDARYQQAVQLLSGQGGWPLTAFLTPDGEVFYGGTYFPPDGKYGRPGFRSLLIELARIYREERQRVAAQAARIRERLEGATAVAGAQALEPRLLDRAADRMAELFDFRYGGFGREPKFPHPGALEFLLGRWFDTGERWLAEMVERTLSGMARGGIYDQLGGGFHRYAVDARWIVPHFEKMLPDNAELLRVYLHAAAALEPAGGEAADYRRVAAGTAHWIFTVLAHPQGGYAASQDADAAPGDDGGFYTWTPDEVRAAVSPEEFEVLARHYDLDEAGEMRHDPRKNVLWIRQSPAEIAATTGRSEAEVQALLASGRRKLVLARECRPVPPVDPTVYTGWSAEAASALLEAAVQLDRPELEEHALRTLERLFREGADGDGAGGACHALGDRLRLLDDQVHLAHAALDAFEVTGQTTWRSRALALAEYAWQTFAAPDGLLYDRPAGQPAEGALALRFQPLHDAPGPSANGVAALLAARLAAHTDLADWHLRLERLLAAATGRLGELSIHGASLLVAADWYFHPPAYVVVVGAPHDSATWALVRAARRTYRPRKLLVRLAPGERAQGLPAPLAAMLDGRAPRAYVCAGAACAAPTSDPAELSATVASFQRAIGA